MSWSAANSTTTSPAPTLLTDPPSLIADKAVTDSAPAPLYTTEVTPAFSEEPFYTAGAGVPGLLAPLLLLLACLALP